MAGNKCNAEAIFNKDRSCPKSVKKARFLTLGVGSLCRLDRLNGLEVVQIQVILPNLGETEGFDRWSSELRRVGAPRK